MCVHTAGVTSAKGDPLELTDDDYDEGWQLDFMTPVRIARSLVPSMVEKGWGRGVYVASLPSSSVRTIESMAARCWRSKREPRQVMVSLRPR